MQVTPEEQKVLTALARSGTGTVFINMLKRRQKEHFEAWLSKLDSNADAHLRGKAAELRELIGLFDQLQKTKE